MERAEEQGALYDYELVACDARQRSIGAVWTVLRKKTCHERCVLD